MKAKQQRKPGAFPAPGDVLTHRFREGKRAIRAKVVEVDYKAGEVAVEIRGKRYPSLSAAATHLSGHPANGWIWWGLQKTNTEKRVEREAAPA